MIKKIEVTFQGGTDIINAIKRCKEIANTAHNEVQFTFNGINIEVKHNSTVDNVLSFYQNELTCQQQY